MCAAQAMCVGLEQQQGRIRPLLSKATYNKYTCQKKEKQQYISVDTVRLFIEEVPSTNNRLVNPFPVYNKDS